jgi:hypothetical protein
MDLPSFIRRVQDIRCPLQEAAQYQGHHVTVMSVPTMKLELVFFVWLWLDDHMVEPKSNPDSILHCVKTTWVSIMLFNVPALYGWKNTERKNSETSLHSTSS